jgi:tetratricopeptide (TPR) repeat protein
MKKLISLISLNKIVIPVYLLTLILVSCSDQKVAENEESAYLSPDVLCGTVQFTDGCSPELDTLISFGFALIHHMTYDDAEYTFNKVIEKDPDCFWGHWGKAMTYIHPVWPDVPSEKRMQKGYLLSQTALGLAKTEKEKLYGNAILQYYSLEEKTKKERLVDFEAAWLLATEKLPDDLEAQMFYVITTLGTVSPTDKSYEVQLKAGEMAENALKVIPDHPGGFHYAIHAYDSPPLADKALRVARQYNDIAPEIPHALHMPTHIFTRLGKWQESIDLNLRSAAAAEKFPVNGEISLHYFHALDYLAYSYLQQSEYEKAYSVVNDLNNLTGTFQNSPATAYALSAIRGRLALEYQKWDDAAKLSLADQSNFSLEKFPQFEALVYYAKGIGAARSGNIEVAKKSSFRLGELEEKLNKSKYNAYWANQVNIQKRVVEAWETYASGDEVNAEKLMIAAADMEDASEKNPVTPGQLLPVREMLGDLYLELGNPNEAILHYNKSLLNNPNRFNSIYGAGKSAELMGDNEKAKSYYAILVENSNGSDLSRERLKHASSVVNGI